jgi:alpha-tubulin suppressor-like RCC1 family protein
MTSAVPVRVQGITTATHVVGTDNTTCAVLADRSVRCWGGSDFGELGDGSFGAREQPGPVPVTDVVELTGQIGVHLCAHTAGGAVYCWGDNTFGQIGIEPTGGKYATLQHVTTIPGTSS